VQIPNMLGLIAMNYQGDPARAKHCIQESLEAATRFEDDLGQLNILNLGYVALQEGRLDEAEAMARQALSAIQNFNNQWMEANVLELLCETLTLRGETSLAVHITERVMRLRQEIGHRWGIAKSMSRLGELAYLCADYSRAVSLLTEALAMVRDYGNVQYSSVLGIGLARAHLSVGNLPAARLSLRSWLQDAATIGNPDTLLKGFTVLAQLLLAEGNREKTNTLLGSIVGYPLPAEIRSTIEELASRVELQLGTAPSPEPLESLVELAREVLYE
jgi:ATP/maltotriose-dependent transcriptional regulator MalT